MRLEVEKIRSNWVELDGVTFYTEFGRLKRVWVSGKICFRWIGKDRNLWDIWWKNKDIGLAKQGFCRG